MWGRAHGGEAWVGGGDEAGTDGARMRRGTVLVSAPLVAGGRSPGRTMTSALSWRSSPGRTHRGQRLKQSRRAVCPPTLPFLLGSFLATPDIFSHAGAGGGRSSFPLSALGTASLPPLAATCTSRGGRPTGGLGLRHPHGVGERKFSQGSRLFSFSFPSIFLYHVTWRLGAGFRGGNTIQ